MQIVKLKLTLKVFFLIKLKQFAGMRKNDYLCSGKARTSRWTRGSVISWRWDIKKSAPPFDDADKPH